MTAHPVTPVERPRSGGSRVTVSRLAGTIKRLNEYKAMVEHMSHDIEELNLTRLTAVVGEERVIESLRERLTNANTLVTQLAAGDGDSALVYVKGLEEAVADPIWSLAQEMASELDGKRKAIEVQTSMIREEYSSLRLNFDRLSRAVRKAERMRLQSTDRYRRIASAVIGKFRVSEADLRSGRYDTAAIAVRHAKSLLLEAGLAGQDSDSRITVDALKLDKFTSDFEKDIATAETLEDKRARRSELFVISGGVTNMSVPYKVLLRRPGYRDIQETNLYDDVEVLEMDQDLFRDTIDRIAETALEGVRSAGRSAMSAYPGGDAETAAPLDMSDQTRRARPSRAAASELLEQLDPTARLEKVGRRMYCLLIPDAMQRLIDETKDFPLTITSNNPELPWELLHDGENFLCLERMFARMPAGQTFPRRTRDTAAQTEVLKPKVLLIHSEANEPLPKARAEIDAIKARLETMEPQPIITLLTGSDLTSSRLTDELSLGNYDVIHYAGHAGFNPLHPQLSYLLLSSGEQFRAERVQRLLEGHPVVFLNACESTRAAPQHSLRTGSTVAQAQGLGSAFVYGGAQACVGSLWPIFDDTAADLAVTFYEHLIDKRQRVGEALRLARQRSHDAKGDAITWAAYALYGDPAYRLGASTVTTWGATG